MKFVFSFILIVFASTAFAANKPVAIIKANPAEGYLPLSVSLSGGDSYVTGGTIVDYSWTFGDGTSGSGRDVTHVYTSTKKKEKVKLVVTDNQGKKAQEQFTIDFFNDVTPPTLSFDVPESFKALTNTPTITAFYNDSTSKVDLSRVRFYLDSVDVTSHVELGTNHAVLQFTTAWPLTNGTHNLKIVVSDYYGNTNSENLTISYEEVVTSNHYLNGKVVNINGQPEANVQVFSVKGPVNSQLLGTTKADGTYSIKFTVGGEYQLKFSKVGLLDIYKYKTLVTGNDDSLDTVFVTEADTKKTYVAAAAGGTATNTSGSISIVIPPGSIDSDKELYFTEAVTGKTLQVPLPNGSQFTYAQNNQPTGTTFSNPADMSIANALGFPAGFTIPVGVTDENLGVWVDSGYRGTVSEDGSRIDYKVLHFTDYDVNLNTNAPVGKKEEPAKPQESKQSGAVKNEECKECKGSRISSTTNEVMIDYQLPSVMRRGAPVTIGLTYASLSAKPLSIISTRTQAQLALSKPKLVEVQADFAGFSKTKTFQGVTGINQSTFAMDFELKNPEGYYYGTGTFGYSMKIRSRYDDRVYAETPYFGAPSSDQSSTVTTREPVYLQEYQFGRAVHVNNIYSRFGAGWTVNGLERISTLPDGTATLDNGSGYATYFLPLNMPAGKSIVQSKVGSDLRNLHYADGFFYGASCDTNEVFKVDLQGRYTTLLSNSTHKNFEVSCPSSVFKSRRGGLYIADTGNKRVLYLSPDKRVKVVAGGDNSFSNPTFVSEDNVLAVHVIDEDEIKTISPFNGKVLSTVGQNPDAAFRFDLRKPTQIQYDQDYNLLVIDSEKGQLIKFYVNGGTSRVILDSVKGLSAMAFDPILKRYFLLDEKGNLYHWNGPGTQDIVQLKTSNSNLKVLKTGEKQKDFNPVLSIAYSPEVGLALSNDEGLKFNVNSQDKNSANDIAYVSVAGEFSTFFKLSDERFWRQDMDKTVYIYSPEGNLIEKTFVDGTQFTYEYFNADQVKRINIPGGGYYEFQYYGFGLLNKIIDPVGRVTEFFYDDKSNLTEIKGPDSNSNHYSYDTNHLLISHTDENNLTKDYTYRLSRGTSVTMPGNRVKNIVNTLLDSVVSVPQDGEYVRLQPDKVMSTFVSPEGRETTFIIDNYGLDAGLIDGNGNKSYTQRNVYSRSTGEVSPEGRRVYQNSDSSGRLIQRYDGDGNKTFGYNPNSLKIAWISLNGGATQNFYYNDRNLLQTYVDARGKWTSFNYNPDGTLEAVFDINNQGIHYLRDEFGNISSIKDRMNYVTFMTRDQTGNLESVTDPMGFKTFFAYDEMNRVTKITDAKNGETFFSYQPSGELESVTDAKGQSTSFVYNENNEVTKIVNALNQEVNFVLDKDGNVLSKTTKANQVINFELDGNSQIIKKEFNGDLVNYVYNRDSLLEEVSDNDSRVIMGYDNYSRLEREESNHYSGYLEYDYDGPRGVQTQSKLVVSNGVILNSKTYDANRSLIRLESNFFGKRISFEKTLDDLNRLSVLKYPNGSTSTINYDANSRPVDMTTNIPGVHYMDYRYTANGNLSIVYEEINQISRPNRYEYDELNRLVKEDSIKSQTFQYDAVGNDQSNSGVFNELNQIVEDNYFSYTYDLNGNQTRKTNKQTSGYHQFTWNAENQLQQVKAYKDAGTLQFTINYKYDGLNRRIFRSVTNHLDTSKSYTRKYVYDGQNIIAILDGNDQFLSGYMYDEGIDEPVVLVTDYNKDGELDALSIVRDRQNSVKLIVNEKKEIVQEVSYSAYGETKIMNRGQKNPELNNYFYYTSRELEPELGIYYYRARYYDPQTGRFLSEDPIGFNSGDVNSYRYVRNNPVSYRDPSGLKLQYGCDLARKEFEDDIEAIRATPEGRKLLEKLENDAQIYSININFFGQLKKSGVEVTIDPTVSPLIGTDAAGPRPATTTRILAHELGHLTGVRDDGPGRMNNVNTWENAIMRGIDGYNRNRY